MNTDPELIQNNLFSFYDQLARTGKLDLEICDHWSILKNEPGFWPGVIYRIGADLVFAEDSGRLAAQANSEEIPGFLVAKDDDIEHTSPVLQKLGFFPFAAWRGMILNEFDKKEVRTPDSVTIEKITTDSDFEQWIKIISEELLNPILIKKTFLKKLLIDPSFEAFILKNNGIGVSTVMVFKTEYSYGLYLIATTKAAQRKGFGQMLIDTVINRLVDEAKKPVILQATPAGEILYNKLGFIPVNRFFLFRHLKF